MESCSSPVRDKTTNSGDEGFQQTEKEEKQNLCLLKNDDLLDNKTASTENKSTFTNDKSDLDEDIFVKLLSKNADSEIVNKSRIVETSFGIKIDTGTSNEKFETELAVKSDTETESNTTPLTVVRNEISGLEKPSDCTMESCSSPVRDQTTNSKAEGFQQTEKEEKQNLCLLKNDDLLENKTASTENESTFINDKSDLDKDIFVKLLSKNADSEIVNKSRMVETSFGIKIDTGTSSEKFETELAVKSNTETESNTTLLTGVRNEISGLEKTEVAMKMDSTDSSEQPSHVLFQFVYKPTTGELNGITDSDVTEVSVIETENSKPIEESLKTKATNEYRCDSDSWSDDDDDDSSSSDTSTDSDFFQMMVESSAPKKFPVVKTRGELGMDELPPIEDLVISVQEEEMMLVGKVHGLVEKIVVIHAVKDMKALDLESVLFLSHDKPLGRVFDVFGPVVEPFYCVRFNSTEEIKDKGVEIGADVFFAPEKSDLTSYIFLDELQKQKGSDASWKYNNEPPEEFLDFSDDEQERAARRKRQSKNRNRQFSNNSDVAAKRPFIAGASSPQSNYKECVYPVVSPRNNNIQLHSVQFPRQNPFASRPPPPSPTPSICSVMSTAARVPNTFGLSNPSQPRLLFSQPQRFSQQNMLQRPPSPILFSSYQQPHAFGQVSLLSPMPPSLHSPSFLRSSFMNNTSALVPAAHLTSVTPSIVPVSHLNSMTPQNYFNQTFPRSPSPFSQTHFPPVDHHIYLNGFPRRSSPISQRQCPSPQPWLPNRSPESFRVPPNHPLTVQIPNQTGQSVRMHALQSNGVHLQPFVNNFHNANVTFPYRNQ